VNRNLYFYKGSGIAVDGKNVASLHRIKLSNKDVKVTNTGHDASILVLQGEPINEEVVKYGPFVMNTQEEIQEAYEDYQSTHFGGWPWDKPDPVFDRETGRVAKYKDGTLSYPAKED
jgi:redox-sensitive bicupin YhaK (pirin superfamily)